MKKHDRATNNPTTTEVDAHGVLGTCAAGAFVSMDQIYATPNRTDF